MTNPRWQDKAACQGQDTKAWFPPGNSNSPEAAAVCGSCSVRAECLNFAIAEHVRFGIWGGMTPRQRITHHRRVLRTPGPVPLPPVTMSVTAPSVRPTVMTAARVHQARHDAAAGATATALAARLGVSSHTMSLALRGRTWPDAGGPVLRYDPHVKRWFAADQEAS